MTTPDMMEALQALAAEKGMTTELLLEAVANGLESAYKRMPEAADDAYVVIFCSGFIVFVEDLMVCR